MKTFLVVVDGSEEFLVALRYAARRAKGVKGRVALLRVVEQQGIEPWRGVARAVDDAAFDEARKEMEPYEKIAFEITKKKPLVFFRKGERRNALLDLVDGQPDLSALVLAAQTHDGGHYPLIQFLTSEKGLQKLRIPLIVIPDTLRVDLAMEP